MIFIFHANDEVTSSQETVCFLSRRALGPKDVRMVVLDISLPTGFNPENSDLEMVMDQVI